MTPPQRVEHQLTDKGYVPVYTTAVVEQPWADYRAIDQTGRTVKGTLSAVNDVDLELRVQRHLARFDAVQAAIGRIKAVADIGEQQRFVLLEKGHKQQP